MEDIPVDSLPLKRLLALLRDPLSSEDLRARVRRELSERGLDLQMLGALPGGPIGPSQPPDRRDPEEVQQPSGNSRGFFSGSGVDTDVEHRVAGDAKERWQPAGSTRPSVSVRPEEGPPPEAFTFGGAVWLVRNIDLILIVLVAVVILLADSNQLTNPTVLLPLSLSLGIAIFRRRVRAIGENVVRGASKGHSIRNALMKASPALLALLLIVAGFFSLYENFSYTPTPEKWPVAFVAPMPHSEITDNYPRPSEDLFIDMSQTYGFWLGQNFSLDEVEKTYPALRGEVGRVRLLFDRQFRDSIEKISGIIESKGGELTATITHQVEAEIKTIIRPHLLTREAAFQALQEVEARAKGEIASPILETLLLFDPMYAESPVKEYLDGFCPRYTSDGGGKARGLKVSVQYPASWKVEDGERPHIVKVFSARRRYPATVILYVNDLGPEMEGVDLSTLSKEEQRELIDVASQGKELAGSLPLTDVIVHDEGLCTLAGQPAKWYEFSGSKHVSDEIWIAQHGVVFNFFYGNHYVSLQTIAMDAGSTEFPPDPRPSFNLHGPLFLQVAQSFDIFNRYNSS